MQPAWCYLLLAKQVGAAQDPFSSGLLGVVTCCSSVKHPNRRSQTKKMHLFPSLNN